MTTAKTTDELSRINDLTHDYWFDIEDAVFDPQVGVVTLPFTRPAQDQERARAFRRSEAPARRFFLKIYHVKRWVVEDRQRVGLYDFNEVVYEPSSKSIKITTGIPIHLVAEVEDLEVSVEEAGGALSS